MAATSDKLTILAVGLAAGILLGAMGLPYAPPPGPPWPPRQQVPAALNGFVPLRKAADRLRLVPAREDDAASRIAQALTAAELPRYARHVLAGNPGALEALRQAARRPGMQPFGPTFRPKEAPLTPRVRMVAQLGLLAFRARLADGQAPAALDALVDVLTAARRMQYAPDAPILVAAMGARLTHRAYTAIGVEEGRMLALPDAHVVRLASELERLRPLQRPLRPLLRREQTDALMLAGSPALVEGWDGYDPVTQRLIVAFTAAALPEAARLLDATLDAAVARDLPRLRALHAEMMLPVEGHALGQWLFRPVRSLSRVLAGDALPSEVLLGFWQAEVQFDALRVFVARERYRRAHGAWPARLEDLVPAYLPAVPLDPYRSGTPLCYAGDLLYSVGPDGLDQGGKPGDKDMTVDDFDVLGLPFTPPGG